MLLEWKLRKNQWANCSWKIQAIVTPIVTLVSRWGLTMKSQKRQWAIVPPIVPRWVSRWTYAFEWWPSSWHHRDTSDTMGLTMKLRNPNVGSPSWGSSCHDGTHDGGFYIRIQVRKIRNPSCQLWKTKPINISQRAKSLLNLSLPLHLDCEEVFHRSLLFYS